MTHDWRWSKKHSCEYPEIQNLSFVPEVSFLWLISFVPAPPLMQVVALLLYVYLEVVLVEYLPQAAVTHVVHYEVAYALGHYTKWSVEILKKINDV